MAKSSFALFLCISFGGLGYGVLGAPATGDGDDASQSFKMFSSNLLMESDLDEFSIEKGAAISSPFGVGYMLANIHSQVWNISNDGFEQVLKTPKERISTEYSSLLEKLHKVFDYNWKMEILLFSWSYFTTYRISYLDGSYFSTFVCLCC